MDINVHYLTFLLQLLGINFKNADRFTMEWEAELIRQLLDYADELEREGNGFHLHIFAKRRWVAEAYRAGLKYHSQLARILGRSNNQQQKRDSPNPGERKFSPPL